jgi:hypothetical protein
MTAEAPHLLDLDGMLARDGVESGQAWTQLVEAPGAHDAWRRAQRLRKRLDRGLAYTRRLPWLVAPWTAILASRRALGAGLPDLELWGGPPAADALLGPSAERSAEPFVVQLKWGDVETLSVPRGAHLEVRAPLDERLSPPKWCAANASVARSAEAWDLEPGEAPLLVTVEKDGALAGVLIVEDE